MHAKAMQVFKLIISVALCFGASGLGVIFINNDSIANWYSQLQKPIFTPPNWVFGPIWTVLYILMGISFFLIWNKGLNYPKVKFAIGLFLIQLILNAIWTPIFFGVHLILLALVNIILLFIAILITLLVFKKISFSASMLLLPYLIWVGCATILNGSICYLNQDKCFTFSSQENDNHVTADTAINADDNTIPRKE